MAQRLFDWLINTIKRVKHGLYDYPLSQMKKRKDYKFLITHGVETEYGNVTLQGLPIISKAPHSRIIIGKGVTIVSDSQYNIGGINHPCILSTTRPNATLVIGDGCGLSGASISCANQVTLKRGVGVGANACIFDHDFHGIEPYNRCLHDAIKSSPITINEYAWLGANSMILKGTAIGRAAVVGACSVVTTDVPELCVFAGNPAHFVRKIEVDCKKYEDMFLDESR